MLRPHHLIIFFFRLVRLLFDGKGGSMNPLIKLFLISADLAAKRIHHFIKRVVHFGAGCLRPVKKAARKDRGFHFLAVFLNSDDNFGFCVRIEDPVKPRKFLLSQFLEVIPECNFTANDRDFHSDNFLSIKTGCARGFPRNQFYHITFSAIATAPF